MLSGQKILIHECRIFCISFKWLFDIKKSVIGNLELLLNRKVKSLNLFYLSIEIMKIDNCR